MVTPGGAGGGEAAPAARRGLGGLPAEYLRRHDLRLAGLDRRARRDIGDILRQPHRAVPHGNIRGRHRLGGPAGFLQPCPGGEQGGVPARRPLRAGEHRLLDAADDGLHGPSGRADRAGGVPARRVHSLFHDADRDLPFVLVPGTGLFRRGQDTGHRVPFAQGHADTGAGGPGVPADQRGPERGPDVPARPGRHSHGERHSVGVQRPQLVPPAGEAGGLFPGRARRFRQEDPGGGLLPVRGGMDNVE